MQAAVMNKAMVLLATAVLILPGISSTRAANKTPGRIGVYARLSEESSSPDKLRQTMKFMKSVGIDFILPSGKGSTAVYWDSQVAPKEMVKDPGYMERIIQSAHAEGLKVYPVSCVATEGGEAGPNALLKRNPSWAFYHDGARRGYIDPGNADARHYEVSLISELVSKYDVDGLSLDYCRCPNRVGYTDSGRAEFLKRHNVDLAKIAGAGPETLDTEGGKKAASSAIASARANPIWPEWQKWKTAQINTLAREIREAVNKAKPGLPISSYVWGYNTYVTKSEVCQDWLTWINEGVLDWINPSGYRYTDESFLEAARLNREHVPKGFPFYITIGVKTSHGTLKDAAEIRKQMTVARQCGADGLVFFTWEALRPFADELAGDIKSYGRTK
jgi:uncharacterized lipoprotein YddW (UPF0748 family)